MEDLKSKHKLSIVEKLKNETDKILKMKKEVEKEESSNLNLSTYIMEIDLYVDKVAGFMNRENKSKSVIQHECLDKLAMNGVFDVVCRAIIMAKNDLPVIKEPSESALLVILNVTNYSVEIARTVMEFKGMLDFIKTALEMWLNLLKDGQLEEDQMLSLYYFSGVLHNCCTIWESSVGLARNAGLIPVLKEILKVDQLEELYKMGVIAAIADIMDENESGFIIDDEAMKSFISHLDESTVIPGLQTFRGWRSFEYGRVIRQLASFDANKRRLVELGALNVLTKLAKVEDETCQVEATSALGHLSFDPAAQTKMVEDENILVIPTLIDLAKSSKFDRVRESAHGTLWMMNAKLRTHKTYGTLVEELFSKKAKGHVMISYSREQRPLLLEIRRTLEKQGFTVWMDVDQMRGDVYDRMAEAVENAAVVMMGMSRSYKMSEYCRREAAYAKQLNKQILPLKVEKGYSPDGWLGIMTAGMFFYDFASKSFEEMASKLQKELNLKVCLEENSTSNTQAPVSTEMHGSYTPVQMHGSDVPDSGSLVTKQPFEQLHVSDGYKKFRDMDKISFLKWLDTSCLPRDKFETFRPKDILYLATMRVEAPEAYYSLGRRLFKDKTNPFRKTQIMADLTEALNKLLLTMK